MPKRYSDDELLAELTACAARLGRSPTMRELREDPDARVHPQTVVQRFGSWNRGKRLAGLVPRRFATREELLAQLRALGEELGRVPRGRDLDARRAALPSKSRYWQAFGSLSNALREAGFDVPDGPERASRALDQGERIAQELGRLPRFGDWTRARDSDPDLLSPWQVYRLFPGEGGWSAYRSALARRLEERGAVVGAEGELR
jgi:hypothetical protein